MKTVTERFLHYVSFDTQSDENSTSCPTTEKQKLLAKALVEEMKEMGISDARMTDSGYVYGTVPGDPELPTIGLIAHMDTSPDASGANVKASIVSYQGGDICLNPEKGIFLREKNRYTYRNRGKNLIVTDGTTLLGADDKAGVAEIMTAADTLLRQGGRHATLKIGFTPMRRWARERTVLMFRDSGRDYAYTVDGGTLEKLSTRTSTQRMPRWWSMA